MAVTVQLTDGTNTVDLNDGTTFTTLNLAIPTPTTRSSFSGKDSLQRSGSMLVDRAYSNRMINATVMVDGTSMDNLISNVNTVHDILRRATDFSQYAYGSQVYLNYQQDSATNAIRFNVITGTYDPIGQVNFAALNVSDALINTSLTLTCEPFGVMAHESFTNYVNNPSFEVAGTSPSTDWTQAHTATGTSANDTTEYIFGATNLKLAMTDSTSGGEWVGRYQDIASAADLTWSLYFHGRLSAASNSVLKLVAQFLDSADNVLLEEDWILDSTSSTDYSRLVLTSIKSPTNTDTLRVWCRLESSAVDATGTAFIDGWFADQATSFPITWMSGRDVYNHLEGETGPDSQEEINYFDVYDVPGDVPSLMQIKAAENEAHTDFWLGARHADRLLNTGIWHEGEGMTGLTSVSDGSSSAGAFGEGAPRVVFDAVTSRTVEGGGTSLTLAHAVTARGSRVLYTFVTCSHSSITTPSGVTYAGDAMTQIGSVVTSSNQSITLWRLVAPDSGTNNTIATFGSSPSDIGIGQMSFYGVDQTTPEGTSVDATGTDDTPTLNVTSEVDDMVISGVCTATGGSTGAPFGAGASQTERYDDAGTNLDQTGSTEVATATSTTMSYLMTTGAGNWASKGVAIKPNGATGAHAVSNPAVITKTVTTPPRGFYKVLVRVNEQGTGPDIRLAASVDSAADPSTLVDYTAVEGSAFHILDVGAVTIPNVDTPENMTTATTTIRLCMFDNDTSNKDGYLRCDWLMLLPVDFGSAFVNKTSAQDVILVDGLSKRRMISLLNTSDVVQSAPAAQTGVPPQVHPLGSRFYIASDNGAADIADGCKISLVMEHRFLSLRGA
jgi:hypothetical protein